MAQLETCLSLHLNVYTCVSACTWMLWLISNVLILTENLQCGAVTWKALFTETTVVDRCSALYGVCLHVAQQLCLRTKPLFTNRARQILRPVFKLLDCIILHSLKPFLWRAPDGGSGFAPVQVCLLVIGQTRQVVKHLITMAALVDATGVVATLVGQELRFGFKDSIALKTRQRPLGAGLIRRFQLFS